MFDATRLLQTLTDALSLGSLYALIAIGYTMVYGVLRLINFAHGEIFMIAMYIVFYGISMFSLPWYVTFTVTILVTALLGTLAERLAYRPLRNAPRISILISAIGVSYFLQNLATVLFGGRPLTFPQIPLFTDVLVIGDVYFQRLSLIVPVIAAVLLLALLVLIKHTKTGLAMRAVSRDYDAASLMGIDLNRTIAIAFFIGSALAGVGAIMWGMKYTRISPTIGAQGLKSIPATANVWWCYGVALATVVFIALLISSSYGRAFKAIREDEIAAESMGVSLLRHKMLSFMLSAFLAAVGGGLFASYIGTIGPDVFQVSRTYDILMIVVMGGMGSISGSVLAAFIVTIGQEWLRVLDGPLPFLPFWPESGVSGMRMVVFSILLLIVILFFRNDLFGHNEVTWRSIGNRLRALSGHGREVSGHE